MQSSYWGYWLIVFGVAIIGFSIGVQGLTTNTNQGYLSTKEIAEASLLESVDYGYYRDYNEVKINKEKFMEVFIRMTAEVMSATDQYEINFYALYEAPPKVSVEVKSNSGTDFINTSYDTVNRVDAIIQVHAEEVTTNSGNSNSGSNNNSSSGSNISGNNGAGTNTGSNNNGNSQSVNSVRITNKSAAENLKVGDSVTFRVEKSPSSAVCTWSSDNTGVATVNNGVVTIKEKGVANITVTCGNKSDSVQIIIDDSTGECQARLNYFRVIDAPNNIIVPGRIYKAKMSWVVIAPQDGRNGTCVLNNISGISISSAIGLNEDTGEYTSTFEGLKNVEIDAPPVGQEAVIETELTFKIPSNWNNGKTLTLNAYVIGSNERQITLTVNR